MTTLHINCVRNIVEADAASQFFLLVFLIDRNALVYPSIP